MTACGNGQQPRRLTISIHLALIERTVFGFRSFLRKRGEQTRARTTFNYSFEYLLAATSTGAAAVLVSSSLDQPPPRALINCTFALS
jgi:hypothetical protein